MHVHLFCNDMGTAERMTMKITLCSPLRNEHRLHRGPQRRHVYLQRCVFTYIILPSILKHVCTAVAEIHMLKSLACKDENHALCT